MKNGEAMNVFKKMEEEIVGERKMKACEGN